jgi:tRNA (guanine-N7-)-methyltransferase
VTTSRRRLNRFRFTPPGAAVLERYYIEVPSDVAASGLHGLPYLDAHTLFGRAAPLFLDLGCGRGEHVVRQAIEHPERVYVGIDVNTKNLHDACASAARHDLDNVRFLSVDLRWGLSLFRAESVAGAWLLFPPPVLRRKWQNKELVRPEALSALLDVLEPGGRLTLATDVPTAFDRWRATILGMPELREVPAAYPSAATRYQRIWEEHGLPTLTLSVEKCSRRADTRRFAYPFHVLDPIADQPGWKAPLLRCLRDFARLPVTTDRAVAAASHTVLSITTHLDDDARAALNDVARKIVVVAGLYAQPFCPPFVGHERGVAEERATLAWADVITVPSSYARGVIARAYGDEIAAKAIVTGFPVDVDAFAAAGDRSGGRPRDMRQILIGQRQDVDKHYLLEADICRQLGEDDFHFVRAAAEVNPGLAEFAAYAERRLGVPARGDPPRYAEQCAASGFVLVTSPSETLCLTAIEAVAAGCIPIVPDHSAFREWCHPDNRYPPYSIAAIRGILAEAPVRPHALDPYRPEVYMRRLRHLVTELTARRRRSDPC